MSQHLKHPPAIIGSVLDFITSEEVKLTIYEIVLKVLNLPPDTMGLIEKANDLIASIGSLYGSDSSSMLSPLGAVVTCDELLMGLRQEVKTIHEEIEQRGCLTPSEIKNLEEVLHSEQSEGDIILRFAREACISLPPVGIKRKWSYNNTPLLCGLRIVRNLRLMQKKVIRAIEPKPDYVAIQNLCDSYKNKINLSIKASFRGDSFRIETYLPDKLTFREQKKVNDIIRLGIILTLSLPDNSRRMARCKTCGLWLIGMRKSSKPPMYHAGTTVPMGNCAGKADQAERKRKSRERLAKAARNKDI